jgi:alpha-galactosidase
MAEKRKSSVVSVCSAVVWLCWVVFAVAIEGRVVPLLQSYEKSGFQSTFSAIYDTSKYGILQLSNGLAETPQMGFVSFRLSLSLSLVLAYLSSCYAIWVI